MPRDGATIFSDLIGKLDVALRYQLQRLIDHRGEDAKVGAAALLAMDGRLGG